MPADVVTAADALRFAAQMLEQGERALILVARVAGWPPIVGAELVRADVVMIAAWLDEHPDVDEQIRSVLALEVET